MVLFGDSQTYSKFTFSQPIFELMTAWTAAHKDLLNIKLALCTGDLVEHNGMLTKFNPRMKSETTNALRRCNGRASPARFRGGRFCGWTRSIGFFCAGDTSDGLN